MLQLESCTTDSRLLIWFSDLHHLDREHAILITRREAHILMKLSNGHLQSALDRVCTDDQKQEIDQRIQQYHCKL